MWRRSSAACLPSSSRVRFAARVPSWRVALAGGEPRDPRGAGDARGRDPVLGHRRDGVRARASGSAPGGAACGAAAARRRRRRASRWASGVGGRLGASASACARPRRPPGRGLLPRRRRVSSSLVSPRLPPSSVVAAAAAADRPRRRELGHGHERRAHDEGDRAPVTRPSFHCRGRERSPRGAARGAPASRGRPRGPRPAAARAGLTAPRAPLRRRRPRAATTRRARGDLLHRALDRLGDERDHDGRHRGGEHGALPPEHGHDDRGDRRSRRRRSAGS